MRSSTWCFAKKNYLVNEKISILATAVVSAYAGEEVNFIESTLNVRQGEFKKCGFESLIPGDDTYDSS